MQLPAGLVDFLSEQPGIRLMPRTDGVWRLHGTYSLDATHATAGHVKREFLLNIDVPESFPAHPPVVFEIGGQIPRIPEFHVNPSCGSLCLGSPLALWRVLRFSPDLEAFLAQTLRPYLYAVSVKLQTGRDFVFGELRHGTAGQLQDLADDLKLPENRVVESLDLLFVPRDIADVHPCPCGCGRHFGACELRVRLDEICALASEAWLRQLRNDIEALMATDQTAT